MNGVQHFFGQYMQLFHYRCLLEQNIVKPFSNFQTHYEEYHHQFSYDINKLGLLNMPSTIVVMIQNLHNEIIWEGF